MKANEGVPICRYRKALFRIGAVAAFAMVVLGFQALTASAQQLTGSLSGLVVDPTGARIPNANVELRNEASGDLRTTVSDKEGYFNITAIQPATYSLTISASGFNKYQIKGVVMGPGDQRSIPNIALKIGSQSIEVTVVSAADLVVPVDTAEISTDLNEKMINDFPLGGRDAGELIKIMPGFARNTGLSQGQAFNSTGAVSSNQGPVGDYSSNGTQPNGSMAFMLDGSNLIDPGNMGTQIANVNQDMVGEVKVLTSSYSAEYAKGPVVFQALSKSGSSHYHGEGYVYARNSALNSWDWFTKETFLNAGGGSALAKSLRPDERYYYYGGNVGGPLVLPFVNFNKAHDKLFFWVGYEYMNQHPASQPVPMHVPTKEQMAGDFSETNVPGGSGAINGPYSYAYNGFSNAPAGCGATATTIPKACWDPMIAGLLAEGAYPTPNVTPSADNSWNNYIYAASNPQNRYEVTGKVSYNLSDSTKLNVSYTRQVEKDYHPLSIWWAPQWTVPYPSQVTANEVGNFLMGNLTHVFNPTTTNEFVFNYSRWINPNVLADPKKVDRKALGFNVGTIFAGNGKKATAQIPNIDGPWGGALSNISESSFNSGFNGGNGFGGIKLGWAFYDNFTKNISTHSLKGGFYWDYEGNQQSGGGAQNGTYNIGWGANGTGNVVADMLLGRIGNYQESNSDPTSQLGFHQWSLYAQDSWKASKQLTLNYGIRADHEGQWYGGQADGMFWLGGGGKNNVGFQVWDLAKLVNAAPGAAPANSGLKWHAIDSSTPLSGLGSRLLTYNPRVGFAYDIAGDGKTVLRGGYAVFQYQVSTQVAGAWGGPLGAFTYTANAPGFVSNVQLGYAGISTVTPPGGSTQNGSNVTALRAGDNKNPHTADWNITISRALPWRSVAEVSYVGNQSKSLYQDGGNSGIGDLNLVQPGNIFLPDPLDGKIKSPAGPTCNTGGGKLATDAGNSTYCVSNTAAYENVSWNNQDWAPYKTYQAMHVGQHSGYANYNSLQANWQKQSGPVTWVTNYTFGKAMGIWDYETSNGAGGGPNVDTFNLKNNYGPLAYDHSHIVNLTYIWNMPNFVKNGSQILRQAVNGWQISGFTQIQSGAPLQPNANGNMNAKYPSNLSVPYNDYAAEDDSIVLPNGLRSTSMNTATWFGTGNQRVIVPLVTCDPRKGLQKGQYFNPKCFAPPTYGQQGTLEMPYMHGPAYFNSDLALFKSFRITENQSFQLRISASNFLNHPLKEFNASGGMSDIQLDFTHVNADSGTKGHTLQSLSQTNTNADTTGIPKAKVGNRSILFAAKYYF